jgi:hypothetical protein
MIAKKVYTAQKRQLFSAFKAMLFKSMRKDKLLSKIINRKWYHLKA